MKKFVFVILFVVLALSACADPYEMTPDPSAKNEKHQNTTGVYVVTKVTGLYDSPDWDAEQIEVLSVGEKVVSPAGGLSCQIISETSDDGTSLSETVCLVKKLHGNTQGWVLKKYIE